MRAVIDHEFGGGADGNGMELYFCTSDRGLDGQVNEQSYSLLQDQMQISGRWEVGHTEELNNNGHKLS